jgi:membrane-associated phospholipid phosphatase
LKQDFFKEGFTMTHVVRSLVLVVVFAIPAAAQSSPPPSPTPTATPTPTASATPQNWHKTSLGGNYIKDIFHDQKVIWTSPFRLDRGDAKWAIPAFVGVGALITTDRYTSDWVDRTGSLPGFSHDVSWFGTAYATGGLAAGFFVAGKAFHNERARETGLIAGEALIDTGIVTQVLKLAARRARPSAGNERAEFFTGGSSFPSGHSTAVWSVATVIAYEYHKNPFIKYGAFAAATAVSMSRFSGRNHFLSDIVIGSATGFGVGRFVYREHHDPDIDQPKPKKTTWLKPMIVPYHNRGTVGGTVMWRM